MKRCPTCQRTYDDSMKFCQADGTPLVDDQQINQALSFEPLTTTIGQSPLDLPPPSPFDDQPTSSNVTPPTSFGDVQSSDYGSTRFPNASSPPTFQESQPQFGNQNFGQQAYGQSATEWSPPPAPQGWGNQGLNQNTPFNAPPISGQGQNNTLAIISLVSGILSIVCCGLIAGIPAIITGNIARKNAAENPNLYGGSGMALAGMIMGGISILFSVVYLIFIFASAFIR